MLQGLLGAAEQCVHPDYNTNFIPAAVQKRPAVVHTCTHSDFGGFGEGGPLLLPCGSESSLQVNVAKPTALRNQQTRTEQTNWQVLAAGDKAARDFASKRSFEVELS